jgi:hypothetical protein
MQWSYSLEAIQDISGILCNPKVLFRVYKITYLVSFLNQINRVHLFHNFKKSILILSFRLHLCCQSGVYFVGLKEVG